MMLQRSLNFRKMQSKKVESPVWQNSCQVLINTRRHGLRSMSVLVACMQTVVSPAKRRVDQFPIIVKENGEQIRQ